MPNPTEPREAESVAVTLVRIETGVSSILEKVVDLRTEVTQHRGEIRVIQSEVQQLQSDARTAAKDVIAADKAREETAAALEKQTADQVAKAKAAVDNSTQKSAATWRPYAVMITVIVALTGIVGLIIAVLQ